MQCSMQWAVQCQFSHWIAPSAGLSTPLHQSSFFLTKKTWKRSITSRRKEWKYWSIERETTINLKLLICQREENACGKYPCYAYECFSVSNTWFLTAFLCPIKNLLWRRFPWSAVLRCLFIFLSTYCPAPESPGKNTDDVLLASSSL